MESNPKSPFAPANDVPLARNPPLAPSQELAYRNKCVQLKKRLQEIENNNDQTRKRIGSEKERIQKQRLLRSILLHQLREIMETPGRKFAPEELERLGIAVNGTADDEDHIKEGRPEGEVLLDDSSDESDEDIPEPSDRPTRTRRQQNSYRGEITMSANSASANPAAYQQSALPAIAPANSFSPTAPREPLLTSSFQTPIGAAAASPPPYTASSQQQPPYTQESHYAAQSSPIHTHTNAPAPTTATAVHTTTTTTTSGSRSTSLSQSQPAAPSQGPILPYNATTPATAAAPASDSQNGYSHTRPSSSSSHVHAQPDRPNPPYAQFCDHMRPQLEMDNYPREHIQSRIDEEWRKLSNENRKLWEERYYDQMREYEDQMDGWKRTQRGSGGTVGFRR